MDNNFVNGMIFKLPHPNAPEFVKGKLSIKCSDFYEYMKSNQNNGWININLKVSRNGKAYAEIDKWKPNNNGFSGNQSSSFDEQELF